MYVVKFICFFLFLRECHGNKGHIVITSEKKIKSRNMTIKTLGRRKELAARRHGGEGCGTEAGLIARRGLAARLRLATTNGLGL